MKNLKWQMEDDPLATASGSETSIARGFVLHR